jgi:hypothetical protein
MPPTSEVWVRATGALRKRFDARLSQRAINYAVEINDAGLVFGAGTVLARMTRDERGEAVLDVDADSQRIFALLAAAYGRPVSLDVFRHIEGASEQWRRGDKALANIRLAFARLPRLNDRADAYRLFHAEDLLDRGLSPRVLMRALGLDPAASGLKKYDPNQPRVPAGNGRQSGRWDNGEGSQDKDPESGSNEAFVGAAAARVAAGSFLAEISSEMLAELAVFAARFATPTAVFGALFIPSPNGPVVIQGTLPDHPDVSYKLGRPEGMLTLSSKASDGSEITIYAQQRAGIYVDTRTGKPLGRDLQPDLFIDADALRDAIEAREKEKPQADAQPDRKSDEPKLCAAPGPDTPHGSSDRAKDYEDDVHACVNPLAPIPSGFAVMLRDPETGRPVYFDDCFRYAGDLVDGDMKKGDFADGKGPGYAEALRSSFHQDIGVFPDLLERATKQTRTAASVGARVKWYFAEEEAADFVRERFKSKKFIKDITIGYMPPSKRER